MASDKQPAFYKTLKFITLVVSLGLMYVLFDIGDYWCDHDAFFEDLRSFIIAILIGLLFSFLLSIQMIREFLLKSISNFMADNSYLKKLSDVELQKLKENVINEIHGTDIVSNKESLFNYIEQLDRFLSIPHKSIVNEKWVFENVNTDMFKLTRVQDYRIHTLDQDTHSAYDLIVRSRIHASQSAVKTLLESIKISIKINADSSIDFLCNDSRFSEEIDAFSGNTEEFRELTLMYTSDDIDIPLKISYDKLKEELCVDFEYTVSLDQEFTQIHVLTERLEEIEYSQGIYSSHAAYGLNYDVTLPEGYTFDDVYHNNTLDLNEENVSVHQRGQELAVNVNGWRLPGLIFVYTYRKISQ